MTPPLDTGQEVRIAGTEALAEALRRAVDRGQAALDARNLARLAARARPDGGAAPGGFALPPVATARRYRVTEVSIAFEAEVRRDAGAGAGLVFVAAVPARRADPRAFRMRLWPGRILAALRRRRFAPVTIAICPDPAREAARAATGTGMGR